MNKKVLVCLDLIKYPNRGLGRVSIDFSEQLVKSGGFDFSYLVPPKIKLEHLKNQPVIALNTFRRLSSAYMKEFDVCHVIHQLPKFSFSKARKMVLTIHDLNFLYTKSRLKQKKYQRMVQSAIDRSDAICFISNFTRDDCAAHLSIPPDKITAVIYNGVNDLATPGQKPVWCPDGQFLFSIGQFLEKKNFHVLIPLMERLPELSLVVAGENDTPYGHELRKMIHQQKLNDRIVLPGAVSEQDKSFLYHHCEAFVFPSIAEGFGLPVIEAMKCGKPVFCSDKTSLKEVGGEFAFFWENFDPDAMLDIFIQGMSRFNSGQFRINAQLGYANSFSWEENVKSYLEIYRQLAG
jgi:glycosyltransferase involved in cell wall biosynthesis